MCVSTQGDSQLVSMSVTSEDRNKLANWAAKGDDKRNVKDRSVPKNDHVLCNLCELAQGYLQL